MVWAMHEQFVVWLLDAGKLLGKTIPPRVNVDSFARHLVTPPPNFHDSRPYLLGAVWAAIDGEQETLKSMSLYGNDLAEAKLFQRLLGRMNVNRIAIRNTDGVEILSISSVGEVSLQAHRGLNHLNAIDALLEFLVDGGYVDWRESGSRF